MGRRFVAIALGFAAVAAFLASRRRSAFDRGTNGGRKRTEQLRREIEDARRRLRDDLARARGE